MEASDTVRLDRNDREELGKQLDAAESRQRLTGTTHDTDTAKGLSLDRAAVHPKLRGSTVVELGKEASITSDTLKIAPDFLPCFRRH